MRFDFNQAEPALAKLDFELELPAGGFDFTGAIERLREATEKTRATLRAEYERQRRCTEIKPDGRPCKAWAVWRAAEQKCINHLSPAARAAHEAANRDRPRKTPRPVCECEAYPFPHRPGNGYCLAPEPPLMVHLLPAGQRRPGRRRRRDEQRTLKKVLAKLDGRS
jgi:hypothetical protein